MGYRHALVLALGLGSATAASALEFVITPASDPKSKITLPDRGATDVVYDLEVGDEWAGMLEVHGLKQTLDLAAEMQFETSVVIGDEGPWVALTDWLHHVSPWAPVVRTSPNQFTLVGPSRQESQTFPAFDKQAFLKAVKAEEKRIKEVGRWSKLAAKCTTPTTDPCYVGVSKVTIRLYETKPQRKLWRQLVLMPALGC